MIKDTIIFDLDGTLLNTLEDLADSVNYALVSMGCPKRTYDEVRSFVGNGVRMLMRRSVPKGTNEEDYEAMFSTFREHYLKNMYNKTAPYEGICELLPYLRDKGYKIGVVSNKLDKAVKELCKDYFPNMIDCAKGARGEADRKPNPENVFACMSELGREKENCFYVGDSEVDITTAKNAETDCICVAWGFRTEEELFSAGAEKIVHTVDEFINLLNEENK